MRFQGAVIREQGVTFAVVVVEKRIVDSQHYAREAIRRFSRAFPGLPIVLMGQDRSGVPTYFGRSDISRFMSRVPLHAVPWCEYSWG